MKHFAVPQTKLLMLCVWTSTTSMAAFGTQDVVLNVPSEVLQMFVNDSFFSHYGYYLGSMESTILWSFIVALLAVGAIFGSLFAVKLADCLGRKLTLFGISNIIALVGSGCMILAQYAEAFELILAGRFILGVSAGISTTVLPMYCIELSPITYRGFVASLRGSIKNAWVFFVLLLSLPRALGNKDAFGYLLGIQAVFSVLQIISYPFCPESPEYLYINQNKRDKAIETGQKYSRDIGESTESMISRWDSQKELLNARRPFLILLKTSPRFRKALVLAAVLATSRGASGIVIFDTYSTIMLKNIGLSSKSAMWATIMRQPFAVVFLLLNTFLVDKIGRRTLYLGGIGLMSAGWTILFVISAIQQYVPSADIWVKWVFLIILELIVTPINCVGPGNLIWFMAAELVPANCRSQLSGFVITFIFVSYIFFAFLYPPISSLIGCWSLLVFFAVPLAIIVIYMSKELPETARTSIADIYKKLHRSEVPQPNTPLLELSTPNSYS